ncbi:restriction endonuclease subunit S [Bacillus pseudomycoides]|uniref:restriction endonuclease subunit S n=1 Tax=Bacillus pseudomycoides TaxID=64104 RepID=UPI00159BA4AB|nr:restriction endonuclease subunit S [Bacillus pseudomycoides]
MDFIEYKLSELGEIITGKTPKKSNAENYNSKDVLFIKPDDISIEKINCISKGNCYVSEKGAETGRVVGKGTILVTCIGIVGKVGIVECGRAIFNQQINAIIPNEKIVLGKYLAYLLYSMQRQLQDKANAPIVPIVNKKNFSEIKVRIPSLTYQEKVIGLFAESQKLIQKRQYQIAALDELTQSLFLEMFGNPVNNEFNWKTLKLEDVIEEGTSVSYGIVQTGLELKEGIPVIRPVDFNKKIEIEKLKKTSFEISNSYSRTILKGNELLLTVRANIGSVILATPNMQGINVTRGITPLTFNSKLIDNYFALGLFRSIYMQRLLKELSKGITLIQLNMKDLRNIQIISPPVELQNKFSGKLKYIYKQKDRLNQSLEEMKILYNSLLQKAFKGELF